MHDSPCTWATHRFALQSDGAQSTPNIITWFPGGWLRLIDKPVHFLFRWKKSRRRWKGQKISEYFKSLETIKDSVHTWQILLSADRNKDGKWSSHAGGPFLQVIRNTGNTCSRYMFLCVCVCVCLLMCCFKYVFVGVCVSVWKWLVECLHRRRIMETLDYFRRASKKLL